MDKLYGVLIILVIIFLGINISINGFSITPTDHTVNNALDLATLDKNFTSTKINQTAIKFFDKNKNMTIKVEQINDTQNVSKIHDNLMKEKKYTSSQKVDVHGVPTYFLYKEGATTYDCDIYFNKNGTNYWINGNKITYADSDYFIKHCKQIVGKIK
ncbi:hypothetical protein J6S88_06925 [bacterium]|nr:hypothetical protein [bacterium]